MKRSLMLLAFAMLLGFSVFCRATEVTPFTKVHAIYGLTTGHLVVVPVEEVVNPAACSHTASYLLLSTESDVLRAMLLTALSAGLQIKLVISNSECAADRPRITSVRIFSP